MKVSQIHDLHNQLENFVNLKYILYNKICHYNYNIELISLKICTSMYHLIIKNSINNIMKINFNITIDGK